MFSYFSLDLISHFMLFAVVHYLCYFFSCHHKSYFWHKNNDGSLMKKYVIHRMLTDNPVPIH